MIYVETWGGGQRLCFGKFRGKPINDPEVRRDYLVWMLQTLDLSDAEKRVVEHELLRRDNPSQAKEERQSGSDTYTEDFDKKKLPADVTTRTLTELISAGRQAMAKRHHPDIGGDLATMQRYNQAADYLEQQVRLLDSGGR